MGLRLAVRAIIMLDHRLLLVNAYPGDRSDLWCAPGGGVQAHSPLPDNLIREVHEETGLTVSVGSLALVNEFHHPARGFHQVEMFFRCTLQSGALTPEWQDPDRVVTKRRFFTRDQLATIRLKPHSLPDVAFGPEAAVHYDPLEFMVR